MNILKIFKFNKKKDFGYTDLTPKDRKDILKKAIRNANEEQAEMVRKYGHGMKA